MEADLDESELIGLSAIERGKIEELIMRRLADTNFENIIHYGVYYGLEEAMPTLEQGLDGMGRGYVDYACYDSCANDEYKPFWLIKYELFWI